MDLGIRGKTALVTASSKGIGLQCALALAAEGARIVLNARSPGPLQKAASEVEAVAGKGNVLAVAADLAIPTDIDRLRLSATERFGAIDICVFIGGSPRRGGTDEITEGDLMEAFQTSVMAGFRLARHVLPPMRARGWGRLVTVQSRSVREPIPSLLTSAATRPGMAGLFKYLANEAAGDGVTVNTIVPGRIDTDRFQRGVERAGSGAQAYLAQKLAEVPAGRLGRAAEIADAVCFLASQRASYINGAALQVDGGAIRAF